ncbi:hypothetical protein [Paenibacillus harenae]
MAAKLREEGDQVSTKTVALLMNR